MNSPKIVDGDLVIKNNEFVMVENDDELTQSIVLSLQTEKGEFFLDKNHGLLHDNIVGKVADQSGATDDIIETISQEERISSVENILFSDNKQNRERIISLELIKNNNEPITIEGVKINAG